MIPTNRFIGIICTAGALAIFLGSLSFREVPGQQIGSSFFPQIIALALAFTGITLIFSKDEKKVIKEAMSLRSLIKTIPLPLAGLFWIFFTPVIGFVAGTTIVLFGLIIVMGGTVRAAFVVGLCMALVLHAVFGIFLRVPLPLGIIEVWSW